MDGCVGNVDGCVGNVDGGFDDVGGWVGDVDGYSRRKASCSERIVLLVLYY